MRRVRDGETSEDFLIMGLILIGMFAAAISVGLWLIGRLNSIQTISFFLGP